MVADMLYSLDVHAYTQRQVTLRSPAPYARVVARFEKQFPLLAPEMLYPWVDRQDTAAFRSFLETTTAKTGFVHFLSFDQGGGMTLLGVPLQSRFYLVGNVLLATDLFRREPAAGLVAPVRVVITGTPEGGSQLDYDEPTWSMGRFPALQDSPVPTVLDTKLRERFASLMHAEITGDLT